MLGTITKARIRYAPIPSGGYVRKSAKPRVAIKDEFEYSAPCPVCDKRALDISVLPDTQIRVRLKCPHCHKLIKIPLGRAPP